MPTKVTLLFTQPTGPGAGQTGTGRTRVGGWSESYICDLTDLALVRARVYSSGAWGFGLANARSLLLPRMGAIVGERFQQVLPKIGSSATDAVRRVGSTWDTDVPNMALLVHASSSIQNSIRRWALKDIPDTQVTFGEYSPLPAYKSVVDIFLAEMNSWGFAVQNATAAKSDILTITAAGLVTLPAASPFVVNDVLNFHKCQYLLAFNTFSFKRKVLSLGPLPTQFTIQDPLGVDLINGDCQRVQLVYSPISTSSAVADKVCVRKIGRPFDQFRGRRSKRRVK